MQWRRERGKGRAGHPLRSSPHRCRGLSPRKPLILLIHPRATAAGHTLVTSDLRLMGVTGHLRLETSRCPPSPDGGVAGVPMRVCTWSFSFWINSWACNCVNRESMVINDFIHICVITRVRVRYVKICKKDFFFFSNGE